MNIESAAPGADTSKGKTKAKKRYLKRKKERRKIRKITTPKKIADLALTTTRLEAYDSDTPSSDDDSGTDHEVVTKTVLQIRDAPEEQRPKKRQKVAAEEVDDMDIGELIISEPVESAAVSKSPTPLATLPSFPLPALPNAPSKLVLALQGLDQALVDAELVDPSKVVSIPEGEEDGGTMLTMKTRKRLKELGIRELFAVQTALLPFLLPSESFKRSLYLPYDPPRDVCASAPTGSGKTLAYVLPIIELLTPRIVTRLRALVVLPTRDLVIQVRETFEAVGKGRGLKIGTATGQHSFAHEQGQLIGSAHSKLVGGSSKVDILICTPGRLMDHLHGTTNFSLQHLRFLVMDEADRLLAQSFQDWLSQVLIATRSSASDITNQRVTSSHSREDGLSPAFLHLQNSSYPTTDVDEPKESSCQKLLFSATLTRDPGKVAALDLRNPKYFVVQSLHTTGLDALDVVTEKFTMPDSLSEHMLVCETSQKPLMLFHLIHVHNVSNALIFTTSTESTTRLVRLFDLFEAARSGASGGEEHEKIAIRAYSSDSGATERKNILEQFKNQEIQILVCSDLISRGIDISHVSHVVSYDAPVDMRKYVHRVGRTARAGRAGVAWTLVEEQEARYFKGMLKAAGHLEKVKRQRVSENDVAPLLPYYNHALNSLKEIYARHN